MDFARAANDGIPSIRDPWPVKDIVYVGIVGPLMLAAFFEWALWLVAFLYCLGKCFVKAGGSTKWSTRVLAVLLMIIFSCLRLVFLPIMVVTLPLPAQVVQYFPKTMVSVLQWFAFCSFAGLLTIPWLLCVYQLVTHNVGRQKRIKTVLDEHSAPKVVIVMPCYNEKPEVLLTTVDSIVDCEYPPSCMHVFLSFDGEKENELFSKTIDRLGVPITLEHYPKSIDVKYRGCRITVSRFPHGGKRSVQKKTYRLIDKIYENYLRKHDNLFMLFIDSDCILDKYCIQNFMYEMELKPGSKHNKLAMTGVITSTTKKHSLITVLQDMEYVHGQLFERSVESACGAVTCLPGALTILRFSAFRQMAKYYFADKAEQCDDMFDYGKCHLGEDRWLTHLFMIGATERYQIAMNTSAFCKTEAVDTYRSLLKQRRRWFLGFITNEACMLTDVRLWKRYPLLLILRLAQNTIRTTALLFFIMVISICTTSQEVANLPVGFLAVSLGLNWALMFYFGAVLGRFKIMLYPLMFVLNPFFNWVYMVYGICTASDRTWGGPRADAAEADEKTTPAQAVSKALAAGDELNIKPETFRPNAEIRPPLMPSDSLEGRFAPAEQVPGGFYRQVKPSPRLHSDMTPREQEVGVRRDRSQDSYTSEWSSGDSRNSLPMPRRVESIVGPEITATYHQRQAQQRPAGGAFFESGLYDDEEELRRETEKRSVSLEQPRRTATRSMSADSTRSGDSSVEMHFPVHPAPLARPPSPKVRIPTRRSDASPDRGSPPTGLAAPLTAYYPSGRSGTGPRIGKSPLTRKSFTRLATDDAPSTAGTSTEVEVRVPRRSSTDEEVPRGRRRRTSMGPDGRRRLSKQAPGSRSTSRA
ncbi:hypothetical protein CKM354_000067700 [Cercospora kikuchii]|uniref:chitin synthase n=1 Tax=Cercospora kikuchii TaxID=84275 RepID=A0A9P3C6H3_9PEZI|nr:uncharacterized protein CKM354_000067700 [Cercospora kikuchii]GIZ37223.1 hypothetical protein CKM354_000067700 [Cercospora kikuchii]